MKDKYLLISILCNIVAIVILLGAHQTFDYSVSDIPDVPEIPQMPLDSAILRSSLPDGVSVSELAEDNVLSELRTKKPDPEIKEEVNPAPQTIDVKLRGLSQLGGRPGAILEVGSNTQVQSSASRATPTRGSRHSGVNAPNNAASSRRVAENKEVTSATGFVLSRLYREGDSVPIAPGNPGLLKKIAPNGQRAVIIEFMKKDFTIAYESDYVLLQSRMELAKKAADEEYEKKMKSTESALKKANRSPQEIAEEEEMTRRFERGRRIREQIEQRARENGEQVPNFGGPPGGGQPPGAGFSGGTRGSGNTSSSSRGGFRSR